MLSHLKSISKIILKIPRKSDFNDGTITLANFIVQYVYGRKIFHILYLVLKIFEFLSWLFDHREKKGLILNIVTRNNIVWKLARRLLFMLLQDFFASVRPHRVHNFFFTEECSTLFVSNNVLGQSKTTNA